jgi:peptide/nickel transport system permease protein
MRRYIGRRLLELVPLLATIVIVTFLAVQFVPGDPIATLVGEEASAVDREITRVKYGLDRPVLQQFVTYAGRVLRGDLGTSYTFDRPVLSIVLSQMRPTLLLTGSALLISVVVGVVLGLAAARRPFGWFDRLTSALTLVGYSIPSYWLAQMAILLVVLKWRLLPDQGYSEYGSGAPKGIGHLVDVGRHLILPALVLATSEIAAVVRLVRSGLLAQYGQPYVRTAIAKGLSEEDVLTRHAFRNAILPVTTLVGGRIGHLFSGAVIIETVFVWPGLGSLLRSAAERADRPLILGIVILLSFTIVAANLLTDLFYTWIDPRVRLR